MKKHRPDFSFVTNCLNWLYDLSSYLDERDPCEWEIEIELLDSNDYGICIRYNLPRIFLFRKKRQDSINNNHDNIPSMPEDIYGDLRILAIGHCENKYRYSRTKQELPMKKTICPNGFQSGIGNMASVTALCKYRYPIFTTVPASGSYEETHSKRIYKNSLDLSIIDDHIRPLVLALNTVDSIQTQYSCQGHIMGLCQYPYVIFRVANLRDIYKLRDIIMNCRTSLPWILKGQISEGRIIQWEISSSVKKTVFNAGRVKEDILILAESISADCHVSCAPTCYKPDSLFSSESNIDKRSG